MDGFPKKRIDRVTRGVKNGEGFGSTLRSNLGSREEWDKIFRVMLIIVAAFLIFGGPTYIMAVFEILDLSRLLQVLLGLGFFVVGVILFMRLIQQEEA